ncbi:MAG: hypothetical protein ABII25_08855 [bacterium]
MRILFYSSLLFLGIYFLALPAVTQTSSSSLENVFKNNKEFSESEGNVKLKMVTRVVAGAVLIVGMLSTIAVQFKLITMGLGTVAEKPETLGGLIILMLLPETIVLLSFVISTLLILL